MLTQNQLRKIMPQLSAAKADLYFPFLLAAMEEFEITLTRRRVAAFLAQLAHESGQLRYMQEIASGKAYEGRRDLGNTVPGDGPRFKGRGPIQLTGRANYRLYGRLLGLDLVENPGQAATPQVGFRIAGLFWKSHGLNELADSGEFRKITRRINGGYNGLKDRYRYYERALNVVGEQERPIESPPEEVTLRINGLPVLDGLTLVKGSFENGTVMVPTRVVAARLGLGLGLFIHDGDHRPAIEAAYQGDSRWVPVQVRGGKGWSPLRELADVRHAKVTWNGQKRTVEVQLP